MGVCAQERRTPWPPPPIRPPALTQTADVTTRAQTSPAPLPEPQAASLADLRWFEVFHDEKLQELVRTALEHNYDLQDAVARIDEALKANMQRTAF